MIGNKLKFCGLSLLEKVGEWLKHYVQQSQGGKGTKIRFLKNENIQVTTKTILPERN